jgi:hypothetical protein
MAGVVSEVIHAGGGLLVLLVATTLSIYKPWGRTRYGRRKQSEQDDASVQAGQGSSNTTPLWVYVSGIIVMILALLFIIHHLASGGLGGHTP